MRVWWCVPQIFAIQLQPEDIIIAGTDGLFDNVFPEESAALMRCAWLSLMVSEFIWSPVLSRQPTRVSMHVGLSMHKPS